MSDARKVVVEESDNSKTTIDKLSARISANVDKIELDRCLAIKDNLKDRRTGDISYAYSEALEKSHMKWYKDMFYWFEKDVYKEVGEKAVKLALIRAMRKDGVASDDTTKRRSTIVRSACEDTLNRELNPHPEAIAFSNGVLNISDGSFVLLSPELPVINKLDYDYKEGAICPRWDAFLNQVLPHDADRLNLQEFVGMIFINRQKVKFEKMCILIGDGSNGKSVAGNTIVSLLGEWNVSACELSSLMGDSPSAMNAIATIDGKLLNYSTELDKKELNGSGFKKLVSGEPVMAKNLWHNQYKAKNIPLLMANTNEMPYTSDKTDAFYRRLMVLDFSVKITDEMKDHSLEDKLRGELSGIFNWAMAGRQRFIEQRYETTNNENSRILIGEYRKEQSSALSFIYGDGLRAFPCYLEHEPIDRPAEDLLEDYRLFCLRTSMKFHNIKILGLALGSECFEKFRKGNITHYRYFKCPNYDEYKYYKDSGRTSATEEEWLAMVEGKIKPKNGSMKEKYVKPKPAVQSKMNFPAPEPVTSEDYDDPYASMPADPE